VDFASALFGSSVAIVPIVVKYWLDEKAKVKQRRLEKIEETYYLLFQMFNWANVTTLNFANLPLKNIAGTEKLDLPVPDLPIAKVTINIRVYFPDLANELESLKLAIADFSSSYSNALSKLQKMLSEDSVNFAELTAGLREKSILVDKAQTQLQKKLEAKI